VHTYLVETACLVLGIFAAIERYAREGDLFDFLRNGLAGTEKQVFGIENGCSLMNGGL
jgi:hypothetical protein